MPSDMFAKVSVNLETKQFNRVRKGIFESSNFLLTICGNFFEFIWSI